MARSRDGLHDIESQAVSLGVNVKLATTCLRTSRHWQNGFDDSVALLLAEELLAVSGMPSDCNVYLSRAGLTGDNLVLQYVSQKFRDDRGQLSMLTEAFQDG